MIGRQLERMLTYLAPWSVAKIDHVAREMRDAGLMPLGGRGPNAPQLTPRNVANFLTAMAASPTIQDAVDHAVTYAKLKPASGGAHGFAGCRTFGEAFASLLEDPKSEYGVREVAVCKSWPLATITMKDGREFAFGYASAEAAAKVGYSTTPIREVVIFSIGALSQIALELAGANDGEGHRVSE